MQPGCSQGKKLCSALPGCKWGCENPGANRGMKVKHRIAEGNGRFSRLDHGKFIGVAQDCATILGVCLDLAASGCSVDIEPAKTVLREIAAMLAGLRWYLNDDEMDANQHDKP